MKLYLDGALGSRGAWLKQPYADDADNRGLPLMDETRLRNTMSLAAMNRFQLAIHAIGDKANAEVLGAIAELAPSYDGDRRWRVEHAQVLAPSDIALIGQHGTIASMQPVHQTSDRLMAEARLGEVRAGRYLCLAHHRRYGRAAGVRFGRAGRIGRSVNRFRSRFVA